MKVSSTARRDPRPGVPADQLYKTGGAIRAGPDGAPGAIWASADGIHFSPTPINLGPYASAWDFYNTIYDPDVKHGCGQGNTTGGRFISYCRSDATGNSQLAGHPKVCGDLGAMRAVNMQQSIDLNSTSCVTKAPGMPPHGAVAPNLVLGPWDATDPNPLGNGGELNWFDTKDADCVRNATDAQRIAYSVDRRSPWNDVYYISPFQYGAYRIFFAPILRHWQYGAIDTNNPAGAQVGPPFQTGGDGIVEPRLMFSEDGMNISYTDAHNARDAYMSLGINTCATAQRGDFSQFGRGWCKPSSKSELMSTAPDTSMIWSGMGMALSPDEQSILTYAITVPFTHNSWLAAREMGVGRHTQVEVARQRVDGFVSVDADFRFDNDTAKMPHFTTVPVRIPSLVDCPSSTQEIQLQLNLQTNVVGFVAVELLESSSSNASDLFTRAHADIIVGNFLARPATWRGGNASVNALAGRLVQLRVAFAAAKVYSFGFECANVSNFNGDHSPLKNDTADVYHLKTDDVPSTGNSALLATLAMLALPLQACSTLECAAGWGETLDRSGVNSSWVNLQFDYIPESIVVLGGRAVPAMYTFIWTVPDVNSSRMVNMTSKTCSSFIVRFGNIVRFVRRVASLYAPITAMLGLPSGPRCSPLSRTAHSSVFSWAMNLCGQAQVWRTSLWSLI